MSRRIDLTPEAVLQLNQLDEWISRNASDESARRFVSEVLAHINGILQFPYAGRLRDDVRPGLRITSYRKRTLIAYVVDGAADDMVVSVIGIFHGGQEWTATLRVD